MNALHRLARSESFHRVPETCPAVYEAGTKAIYSITKWVDTVFAEKLSENDRNQIAGQVNAHVTTLLETIKEQGTVLLRTALIAEIEQNMRLSLTQERIDRIEAGENPEDTLQHNHHTATHAITTDHVIQAHTSQAA
jgi:hypothetical protein